MQNINGGGLACRFYTQLFSVSDVRVPEGDSFGTFTATGSGSLTETAAFVSGWVN